MTSRALTALLVALLLLLPGTTGLGPTTPTTASAAPATLAKPPVPERGAYLGASASVHDGETRTEAIVRTERQIGRPLAINHQFYRWDQSLVTHTQHDDARAGRYPFVSWKPQTGDGRIITWGSVAAGHEDAHIRAYARAMRDFGHPMFATFHHEPYDETTKGWGTAAEFRAAFRRVVELFRQEGAGNVAWVLVLTSWDYSQGRGDAFDPGADVVDWYAADPYNFHQRDGRWDDLAFVTRDFYEWGTRRGRPLMLAEWGSTEDPGTPGRKAAWYDAAAATLAGWPNIKAAVYFNNLHAGFDWRIDTSPAALDAFRRLAHHPHFAPSGQAPPPAPDPLDCDGGADAFTDVGPADVLRDAIACVAAYGIVEGTSPTTFEPSERVTRGQVATFVANTLRVAGVDLPEGGGGSRFDDVDGSAHQANIDALAAAGLIRGYRDGTFRPSALVNRAQVATFVVRAHEAAAGPLPLPLGRVFTDIGGNAHADNIDRAEHAGIVAGTSRTTFSPDDRTSRAQLAGMLTRLLRRLATNGVSLSQL